MMVLSTALPIAWPWVDCAVDMAVSFPMQHRKASNGVCRTGFRRTASVHSYDTGIAFVRVAALHNAFDCSGGQSIKGLIPQAGL